jgi:hypothetical protein
MNGNFVNQATRWGSRAVRVVAILGVVALGLVLKPDRADAATVDLGTASGPVGDTVLMPVELSELGGESVWSFELDFRWSASYAQFVGVSTSGALSASWATDFYADGGTGRVAAAGGAPLSADGTLIWLEFQLGPSPGTVNVILDEAVLNEGTPETTLVNGQLIGTALPSLNIYPDSGLLVVGETMTFSTSGGTGPYTYTSSNPAVASFAGGDLLTAHTPGFVQVTTEDSGGLLDTTTGQVEVRPFRLEIQPVTGIQESTVLVPVLIDDPSGYGIVSCEFEVSWYWSQADFVGVEIAGTLMESAGWGDPQVLADAGEVSVIGAGVAPLSGPGVLVYLRFLLHNTTNMTPSAGIFNEEYAAFPVAGWITATPLPTLSVSPYTANLMVEDTQLFTVVGSPTPPLTWSVDDPAVASINAAGELTALADGLVQVRVEDSLGAVALSGPVTICTIGLPAINASVAASEVVVIPIPTDRWMTGMDIYSLEVSVSYHSSNVMFLGASSSGTATESWGAPVVNDDGNSVSIYHAGATPLEQCGTCLVTLAFLGAPDLSYPYTSFSLTSGLFNEGSPCVRINYGTACSGGSAAPLPEPSFLLLENHPNPFNPLTTIRFRTEVDGQADLFVYSARGELVRHLFSGFVAGGSERSVIWSGRNDAGRLQASGVYYGRLESGERIQIRKMVLLK